PQDRILMENKSTNTGENVAFSRALLLQRGINPQSSIVVHKPYAERRAFVTFRKVWPELKIVVASPECKFEDYPNDEITKEHAINVMVGDFQRIMVYSQKGYSIPQIVPNSVLEAYRELVHKGFDRHMIKG
ncbi:MAG: YdcF family protein, partial [Clostridia bacterium]|nr:YdcF family protein [Clostridia bacterium]